MSFEFQRTVYSTYKSEIFVPKALFSFIGQERWRAAEMESWKLADDGGARGGAFGFADDNQVRIWCECEDDPDDERVRAWEAYWTEILTQWQAEFDAAQGASK